ncbi:MAG: MarR family transcriptional regulator [Clostridia bacterium]|nr:MarR family transcriptional regulator [Clostridia bacterium]
MDKYINASAVFSRISREYRRLHRGFPIRPSEIRVLSIIADKDENITPLRLSEIMEVSKAMIAAHIQTLLEKGYIYKVTCEDDKRSFFIKPTDEGIALVDELKQRRINYMMEMEKRLGENNFDALIDLLAKAEE